MRYLFKNSAFHLARRWTEVQTYDSSTCFYQPAFPWDKIFLIAPQECRGDRETYYIRVGRVERRTDTPAQSRAAGRGSGDSMIAFDYSSAFPAVGRTRETGGVTAKHQGIKARDGPGETPTSSRRWSGDERTGEIARSNVGTKSHSTTQVKDKWVRVTEKAAESSFNRPTAAFPRCSLLKHFSCDTVTKIASSIINCCRGTFLIAEGKWENFATPGISSEWRVATVYDTFVCFHILDHIVKVT